MWMPLGLQRPDRVGVLEQELGSVQGRSQGAPEASAKRERIVSGLRGGGGPQGSPRTPLSASVPRSLKEGLATALNPVI